MSLRRAVERVLYANGWNPFDRLLKEGAKRGASRILLCWNRGLGDIPLGLYAMITQIRRIIPNAEITFLTREGLGDGFALLPPLAAFSSEVALEGSTSEATVKVLKVPGLKRGESISIEEALSDLSLHPSDFHLIIENPDPTKWVRWQLGTLTPKLTWKQEWDSLYQAYGLDPTERYIGAHIDAESGYALWRNWPPLYWKELFERISQEKKGKILLFGFKPTSDFSHIEEVIDLRGKTSLFSLLSIIKQCCDALIVPDSGIGSITYFLSSPFALRLISLWADPYMGILKQNVASPNPELVHIPLIAPKKDLSTLSPSQVYEALCPLWTP